MRILHLCPLWLPMAPDAPGGIETLLARLSVAFERRGCDCTWLATGDSVLSGELVPILDVNLCEMMKAGDAGEYVHYQQEQLLWVLEHGDQFDVIHSHAGPGALALSGVKGWANRVLHTVHGPVYGDMERFVARHRDFWYSTVSEFQGRKLWEKGATRCSVVYNGTEVDSFTFQPSGGDGLFFIGRMETGKGPDLAIQVAKKLGCPLILAGPIVDQGFFNRSIAPFLDDTIRYVGVVDHRQKNELYGKAGSVILPFRHEEGFGLVVVEAMACGTPVVALAGGAIPELINNGVSGYATGNEEELSDLVKAALRLDRTAVRRHVAENFDIGPVATNYIKLYDRMIHERRLSC